MKSLSLLVLGLLASPTRAAEPVALALPPGWTAHTLEDEPPGTRLVATEKRASSAAELVFAIIPRPLQRDYDRLAVGTIDKMKRRFPGAEEVRRDYLEIDGVRSLRLQLDVPQEESKLREVLYMMPAGTQTAELVFRVDRDGADARLADFEAIARTTRGLEPAAESEADRKAREDELADLLSTLIALPIVFFSGRFLYRRFVS